MVKDITAILVHYSNRSVLHKAVNSLKKIKSRLKSVIVFQDREKELNKIHESDWLESIQYIKSNDVGKTMDTTINRLDSTYVLFLYETDYLSPELNTDSLYLSHPNEVLGTCYHNKNIAFHRPILVRTSFFKKQTLFSNLHLPFMEALFPAWLSTIDDSFKSFKDGLTKQGRINSSANTMEKQNIIQKFQLGKIKTEHPTLSVLISNYNMEEYVDTAVVSCLLQNEQLEQILIMDDGSTDNSYEKLQHWNDGKRIMVFNKKNEGKAKALNDLLPHVSSDFILELDADDWLDSDAVSVIKKHLSDLPDDISVLYGNLRRWKQSAGDVLYKGMAKGTVIKRRADLLSYRFPLGPRIYRAALLKKEGGFPVIDFKNGRLYEDVSVLNRLLKISRFLYRDFTVYNVREHEESITKNNHSNWKDFLRTLK